MQPQVTKSRHGRQHVSHKSFARPARPRGAKHVQLEDQLQFERLGWVVLKSLVEPNKVLDLKQVADTIVSSSRLAALQHRVRVLCPNVKTVPKSASEAVKLLQRHGTDTLGFLQFFNNWTSNDVLKDTVFSETLAGTAAELLGVPRVRLFQDCIFYKEPGYDLTNWHSDLRMTPLDTNSFITAWIPLRPIGISAQHTTNGNGRATSPDTQKSPETEAYSNSSSSHSPRGVNRRPGRQKSASPEAMEDSGLMFASGSHRDFALPFWHDLRKIDLAGRGYPLASTGVMELGDVSWHHGWTLHCAGPQPKSTPPRMALAVSYFADGSRILRKSAPSVYKHMLHDEDAESYGSWLSDLKEGQIASHKMLPLVYPAARTQS